MQSATFSSQLPTTPFLEYLSEQVVIPRKIPVTRPLPAATDANDGRDSIPLDHLGRMSSGDAQIPRGVSKVLSRSLGFELFFKDVISRRQPAGTTI